MRERNLQFVHPSLSMYTIILKERSNNVVSGYSFPKQKGIMSFGNIIQSSFNVAICFSNILFAFFVFVQPKQTNIIRK